MVEAASSFPPPPTTATATSVESEDIRARELAFLKTAFSAERGSVVVVAGRRGVGKARLIEELVRYASAQPNAAVLEGRTPHAGGKSFHPFAEIARQAMIFAEHAGATEQLIDPVYDELAAVLEHAREDGDTAPSLDQKLRFFDGFRRLLSGISERARLCVVVHDLERADNDTLELASYLADELFGDPTLDPAHARPGLLALLIRDDALESNHARALLAEAAESPTTKILRLQGLDLDGLKRYVQSPRVLEKLLSASRGIPQEIDALIDSLPTNVEELFERKLSVLDPISRSALSGLAISGRASTARTLSEVTGHALKQVAHALSELRDQRILERRIASGEFQFSFARRSDLEVTSRTMSGEDRARFHAGWAAALAKDPESGTALLAHHQLRSTEPARGVPLAVQAAEGHAVAGAFDSALQVLEAARPHANGEMLLQILSRLAELAPLNGSPRIALRYVEEWKAVLPEEQRGRALLREAELYNAAGDYDRALVASDAARLGTPAASLVERASIEATASESYYHLGALEKAAASGEAGLALLASLQDAPARPQLELLNLLGKIALAGDKHDRASALFHETLAIADAAGLAREQARALVNLGHASMRRGAMREAQTHLIAGIERAQAANDLPYLAFGHMNLGVVLHQRGELGRAIDCYRECKSLFRRLGNRTQLARVFFNLGALYVVVGDLARARAHNDEALRIAKSSGVERLLAVATALDGQIAGELGDREVGEARLREAMILQKKLGVERPAETMLELAQLQLRFGDVDRAETTLAEVEDSLAAIDNKQLTARAELLRGRILLAREDVSAIGVLRHARDAFAAISRRLTLLDAEVALGRAHHLAGQMETARMHLGAAEEIARAVAQELPEELRTFFESARPQQELRDSLRLLDQPVPSASRPFVQSKPAFSKPAIPAQAAAPKDAIRRLEWASRYGSIIGSSPKVHRVFHIVDRVAASDGTVLICGESGTGKELVAEAIHRNSPRAKAPFVKLNCAALVESLLLSELFGHERGSFTGAHQRKIGRFEMAAGGTIFLDEIGDISPKTQVSLLRVLQEREFERVGGGRPIKVEARIVVATNRNLSAMVKDGTFREDLYYRLKGLTIDMPPLRERLEDILELAQHFLAQYAIESGALEKRLSKEAQQLLLSYSWPGNIRELENIIRSVALFAESSTIEVRDFDEYRELFQDGPAWTEPRAERTPEPAAPRAEAAPADLDEDGDDGGPPSGGSPPGDNFEGELLSQIFAQGIPLPELKKRLQEQAIARALRMTKGNITRAAEVLGMRRPRLSQIINASEQLKSLCQGGDR